MMHAKLMTECRASETVQVTMPDKHGAILGGFPRLWDYSSITNYQYENLPSKIV